MNTYIMMCQNVLIGVTFLLWVTFQAFSSVYVIKEIIKELDDLINYSPESLIYKILRVVLSIIAILLIILAVPLSFMVLFLLIQQ